MRIKAHRMLRRIKPKFTVKIIRNGKTIFKYRRKRDLLVYDGQLAIAYLVSRGAVGVETGNWMVVASENTSSPNMADSSGDPLNNEFNPVIGSLRRLIWRIQAATLLTTSLTPLSARLSMLHGILIQRLDQAPIIRHRRK